MTCVSLADVCRRLGIDAKTLRSFLADAQLPKPRHPRDGRKKGVSREHLDLLARLHHRSLASLASDATCPRSRRTATAPRRAPREARAAEHLASPDRHCAAASG